ncbi:Pectate lyase superfamily protein [uncultured Caudovirales phage]|uniref:Pectate lyase superfamily protein n=1 Tax=uncultured Caudovirales phage TaxID=2100421 RepID=A0A6J5L4H6_9CAUD|nr:Pectate lyase superfamily protein [uncultured Caudovirales phage]CAB4133009.1 Pectate lyase superfamily protein [uncultured Caudovirales phage]
MTISLSLLAGAGAQFFTDAGAPLAGGLLYTYAAGTTTPATTYSDNTGLVNNANPIVLDAAGRVSSEIWLTDGVYYKFVLKTSTGVQIWSKDNISNATSAVWNSLSTSSGSSLVGFLQSGTGAVATTVQTKLRETVSVKDFGAVGDGVTDDTAAIQAAITYVGASGAAVYFPAGTYLVSTITLAYEGQRLVGAGKYRSVIKMSAASTYGIQSPNFGVRGAGTIPSVFTVGFSIEELAVDMTATANLSTVAAIALEDTYDVTLINVRVIDPLDTTANRWGLWLGRAVYTTSTYQCVIGRLLHKGNGVSSPNNFGTTVTHQYLDAWYTEHDYYQIMQYLSCVIQKDTDKFVLGDACGPFVVIGGDFEGQGYLFKSNVVDGAAGVFVTGATIRAMTGNIWGGVTYTNTGSSRVPGSFIDCEYMPRQARSIVSASRSGSTVTIDLPLTTALGSQFAYMAPDVGEYITVAGTGTAMDGTGFVVASRTVTYPTVNRITYTTATSGALGPITTGTVTPDASIGYRYTRLFGNNFGWDPAAGRFIVNQRPVLKNNTYVSGFKADGTTEVQLIGVDTLGRLSMTDGSTYQYIDDGGNFRNTKAGKGFTVTSPDGLTTKTITINNAGVITLI